MNHCIDAQALSDYLAGRTSHDLTDQLELHFATCAHCQQRMADLEPRTDALVAVLRQVADHGGARHEPELLEALSAASSHSLLATPKRNAGMASLPADGSFIRDYQLLKKLGEGGMGSVYLAMHTWLQKSVAVKFLQAERNSDPQAVLRFEREMRAVGRLEHPHIVRAFDAGHENGAHFLVMEYITGIDLARLVKSLGQLSVADACELARQAALGLQHAHDNQLVHRDVKPSNLMLNCDGQIKVLDLGLAHFLLPEAVELTKDNQILGTWRYVAPEQLVAGTPADTASDIYSLGVTLYELLVGPESMRRDSSPLAGVELADARSDVPPALWRLLRQMLAVRRENRPASMHEVAQTLATWCQGADPTELLKRSGRRQNGKDESRSEVVNDEEMLDVLARSRPPIREDAQVQRPTIPGSDRSSDKVRTRTSMVAPLRPTPHLPSVAPKAHTTPLQNIWQTSHFSFAGIAIFLICPLLGGAAYWAADQHPPRSALTPPPLPAIVTAESDNPLIQGLLRTNDLQLVAADGQRFVLREGANTLPPGQYDLVCKASELLLATESVTLTSGETESLALRQQPISMIVPQIRDEEGHVTSYKGDLWYEPLSKNQRKYFDISFVTMGDEDVGDDRCRWLKITIVQACNIGSYTETGYVLIDMGRWRQSQQLGIKRGWVFGSSASIRERLKELHPEGSIVSLVTQFDGQRDTLLELAGHYGIMIPENRLSLHEALVLLFDDLEISAVHPAVSMARKIVSAQGERMFTRQELVGPFGSIPTLAISMTANQRPLYKFYRNDTVVPFGFAQIDVTHQLFDSHLKVVSYGRNNRMTSELPTELEWQVLVKQLPLLPRQMSPATPGAPPKERATARL